MTRATQPIRRRVVLELDAAIVHALKVRAAQEGIAMRDLVERWVRSWTKPNTRRPGGRP
jgi:hypothetical protein